MPCFKVSHDITHLQLCVSYLTASSVHPFMVSYENFVAVQREQLSPINGRKLCRVNGIHYKEH